MAGRISDADVALVRERSGIDAVVGEHLQLRSAGGGELKGLCPFHEEKSPSFHVTPSRGLFHCFGCGVGGDVITFVRRIENLDFTEAVEKLAAKAGIELHYEGGGAGTRQSGAGQRQRLVEAHAEAARFFSGLLTADAEAGRARAFLTDRGFDAAAAERFGLGFAPRGWDGLVTHLSGRGFHRDELLAAGLATESRRSTLVDRFRSRLVWPIREVAGDVVAFGARRLFDDDHIEAKYVNSPETPLFKKSRVLYGADLAKVEIARRHQAVVVEGYTDVMACHLAGVATAVATCGTSFGEDHVVVLRRLLMDQDEFRGEVVFTFDGDAAGQKAALRAGALDQRFTAQTFVAVAPGGQDPCDLRLSGGDAAVRDLVAARVPLFEFVIKAEAARYDLDTPEGRVAALEKVTPVLRGIKDRGLRLQYATVAARHLGFEDVEPVRERVLAGDAGPGAGRRPGRTVPAPRPAADPVSPAVQVEREALKAALQRPALVGPAFDALDLAVFTHPVSRSVHATVVAAGGVAAAPALGPAGWVARVREAAPDDAVRSAVTALAVEPLKVQGGEAAELRYVAALVPRVEELAVTRRLVECKARLQRMAPVGDTAEEYNRLVGELFALEARKRSLREQAAGGL